MTDLGFWHFAQQEPSTLAIVDPNGKEWSRGELLSDSNRIVYGLRALGLGQGDVVAAVLPNCAEFIALFQAVAQAGWYLVPINWHLAGPEVAYILKDSDAKAFISHNSIADSAIAAAKEADFPANAAFSVGHIDGFRPWAELLDGQPDTTPDDRSAGVVMNYTSGTTGKPKGVKRGLSGLDPETYAGLFTLSMQMFGIQPEDNNVHITGSPLYHTAVMVWASNSLHLGHPVVLMERWDAEDMLRLIDKYKVTHSHMVPTQFRRLLLLDDATRGKYDLSSLRYMIHAAAPCPPDVKHAMLDWWGMVIYEYYAATEGGGTLVTPEEWLRFPGTVGRPWPTAEVKTFDDDGNEMPTGKQGTVYMLLAENQRFEYKGDLAKTQKERLGNYFTVGDVGYLNAEGYLFLCDRKIDMIISGGANIYPAEIENVLVMHPKVADVAVFGIPNDDWGEEIKAAVEPVKGVAADAALSEELMAFCKEKLAKFKLPKSIDYLEELPRDPNGKLYKRRLRDPYWEGQAAKV